MKKIIPILCLVVFTYATCKKDDVQVQQPASSNGYWKGSTNTYGIGLIVRENGTARELVNTSSLTLDDTSSANVSKFEGTYTIIADSIFVNSNVQANGTAFSLKGKMNSSFSSMQGGSKLTGGGLIINQTFTMTK